MSGTPAPLRRTPLAIATALALMAGMLTLGMTGASAAAPIRLYSPTLTANTSCVAPGSVNRFTATITNSSSSNQPLGSAMFHSNRANGFRNISFRSFTRPVASGGKTWQALPDIVDGAGIYLRAASSSQALSPGQSVTVTFQAKAPSSVGPKTWVTKAWQSTLFLSGSFSLATVNPVVTVGTNCPATFPNGGTVTAPPGTSLEVVPNIDCGGSFPGFAGTVQITPPAESGDIVVIFDDPYDADLDPSPPFCKGEGEGQVNPVLDCYYGESESATPPCILSQNFDSESGHLVTTLLMNSDDPPVRH
jgi:hypothetical protein